MDELKNLIDATFSSMSAIGTKQTLADVRLMSAFGVEADMGQTRLPGKLHMRRSIIHFPAVTLSAVMLASAVGAQPSMKPTAPQKMMSPDEQVKIQECQKLAAQRNIAMDQRAKFLMNCMTDKAK